MMQTRAWNKNKVQRVDENDDDDIESGCKLDDSSSTTGSSVSEPDNFFDVPAHFRPLEEQLQQNARPGHLVDGIEVSIIQDNKVRKKGKAIIKQCEKFKMSRKMAPFDMILR